MRWGWRGDCGLTEEGVGNWIFPMVRDQVGRLVMGCLLSELQIVKLLGKVEGALPSQ